jgi:hypothetical protein
MVIYNECFKAQMVYRGEILPASTFRENDKMGIIGHKLNEFDAGKVFPVAHGLFK